MEEPRLAAADSKRSGADPKNPPVPRSSPTARQNRGRAQEGAIGLLSPSTRTAVQLANRSPEQGPRADVTTTGEVVASGRIVEVEAYLGVTDPASPRLSGD